MDANNGAAQNMLGYATLRQGDTDGPIAAFNEYVRIMPQEPNAQDSLGEALMAAGRFKDAESAFRKALELSPQFWGAHQGIAMARYYAGDLTGARGEWKEAKATATRAGDKISVDTDMAAVLITENKIAEALQILQDAAKTESAPPAQGATLAVLRAQTLIVAGRPKDALPPIAEALKAVDSGQLPPAPTRNIRGLALRARVSAEALLKDVAAAKATSAVLDMEAASRADDIAAQDAMHWARRVRGGLR